MARLGEAALLEFGTVDTWVNNAGLSIYGKLTEVPARRQAQALRHQLLGRRPRLPHRDPAHEAPRRRPHQHRQRGVGRRDSAAGDLLGVEARRQGIHRLAADGTGTRPYPDRRDAGEALRDQHAATPNTRGTTSRTACRRFPRRCTRPEVVAEAILRCAERPVRDVIVGGAGRVQVAMGHLAPRLTDVFMERVDVQPAEELRPDAAARGEPRPPAARRRGRTACTGVTS